MTDHSLTIASALFELSVPVAIAIAFVRVPATRKPVAVVLGAITPLVAAYACVALGYLLAPQENVWAVGAMWVISFVPFLACAVIGALLAFIDRPNHPFARFVMGFSSPLLVWLLVLAGV